MPYNIDPNQMRDQINSMFGPNAYENRVNTISNVAKLKVQLDQAQKNYNTRLKAHNDLIRKQQEAAQKAATQPKKKSYIDAVDELAGHTTSVKDAAKLANDIRNDPTKQQAIKSQGYTVTDYINALYNASSNGKYHSEREYKQAEAKKKKQASDPLAILKLQSKQQPKQNGRIGGFLGNLGHDLQSAYDHVIVKPTHAVEGAVNNFLSQEKAHIDEAKKTGKSKGGISVNLGEILNAGKKGWNSGNVSGADVLKTAGIKNKTAQKIGGGALDFTMNPLNLAPYAAAEGLFARLGLGAGVASKVGSGALGRIAGMATEGAAAGGLGSLPDALLNPHGGNAEDRAKEVLGMALLGGGLGAGAKTLGEGGKAINSALDNRIVDMLPKNVLKTDLHASPQGYQDVLNTKALPAPSKYNVVNTPLGIDTLQSNEVKNTLNDLHSNYNQKMNDSVNQALDHAKNTFVGQGMQKYLQKSYELEASKTLASDYKKIRSAFPKGIKIPEGNKNDFQIPNAFKAKSGSAVDIYQAAEQMGFKTPDEFISYLEKLDQANKLAKTSKKTVLGFSTPEQAQKNLTKQFNKNVAPNVKSKLSELFHQTPDAQAIKSSIEHLNNVKGQLDTTPTGVMQNRQTLNYVGNLKNPIATRVQSVDPNVKPIEPLAQLQQTLKQVAPTAEPKAMNISSVEPPLKKLTKSELIQEQNLAQFANNNADSSIPDTSGHIVSKKDLKPSIKGILDLAYTKGVDNLHPLNKFDKAVEKVTGIPLKPSENTHMLALNSRGSDQISKQILTQNLVNSKNEVIGQSLKDITKNLDANQLKLFEDYLVNKHAITRMQRGEKVFSNDMKMSPEKSAQIVKAYEKQHPEFKQLAKQYYDYNKKLGKAWLVDTGILTKDEWNAYLERNPYYVPNHRAFNPLEKSTNMNAKRGYAGQSNPVKKATGSQRKIISPIESTIEHTARYVKTAKRNEVMQALIKNITKNPEDFKGFAEIVKTDKTPHSVLDTLNKEGIDGLLSEFNKGFDQKPDLTHGNIVTGIIDGQKVHVRVHDPQLLDALTNLAPPEQHLVFKFFGKVTRVMKNLTTGINPVFSLTRNVFRDIPTSYTNSKTVNNPVKFSKDLISAFLDVVGNREAYQSFKNFGGGHSSPISSDVNLLAQSKRSILKQKGIKPLLGKGLGALENLNNAIESAPRLAEYKRTAVHGNYDSHIQALYNANDITTNFNKFGNFTKGLDSLVPYLNAAVQGLDKMARQFKENPVQTSIKAAGSITLPTIILYAVNHNNPNYQQLSNYVKDNNFLIPLPNGTFYKIPKPRELGMVFSTDIERTLRAWADSDPHAFQGFVQDVIGNFAPPVRTIVSPFNDLRANKNFMGAPIVPGDLQNLSPKYQYDSQTSSLARGLGNLTNKSPKQIDYLIKSYGGVLGQLGIPAMSPGATVGSTLRNQVIADPVFSNDIMSNFYNTKNKLDMARNDYTKQGAVSPDLNEKLRKAFDAQGRNISKVRKEIKAVQNSSALSNQDKQAKIRQLQQIMNQIAQQTNQLAR